MAGINDINYFNSDTIEYAAMRIMRSIDENWDRLKPQINAELPAFAKFREYAARGRQTMDPFELMYFLASANYMMETHLVSIHGDFYDFWKSNNERAGLNELFNEAVIYMAHFLQFLNSTSKKGNIIFFRTMKNDIFPGIGKEMDANLKSIGNENAESICIDGKKYSIGETIARLALNEGSRLSEHPRGGLMRMEPILTSEIAQGNLRER